MKLRFIAAFLLLLVAIGLPLAAVSSSGPPWGFRGHQAVVVEVTGTVEATASEVRRQRSNSVDDHLEVIPGLALDDGDEVRVARLGEALLRTAVATIRVGDGARLLIGTESLKLTRGQVQVTLLPGARSFAINLDSGGSVVVRGAGATATLLSDGKGNAQAFVDDGSLDARVGTSDTLVEPGKLLTIRADVAAVGEKPTALSISATCTAGRINVVSPVAVQVFAAGSMGYPDVAAEADTGSLVFDADDGRAEVPVLARDVTGKIAQISARCAKGK